jgi:hypothetical protein
MSGLVILGTLAIIIGLINARAQKRKGYSYWSALFFTILLIAALFAILYKGLAPLLDEY